VPDDTDANNSAAAAPAPRPITDIRIMFEAVPLVERLETDHLPAPTNRRPMAGALYYIVGQTPAITG
jgi:hypothetical protein